ncbi:HlyD family efflux transporter periplasmic adaptor subunit [Methylobacterium phyllosphaerae]
MLPGPALNSLPNADCAAHKNRAAVHSKVVRVSAYSVATVLALLMTSATLPPLIADQSDRAVINAPITLITAPIPGEVTKVYSKLAEDLEAGESIVQIHNGRVDRSTLIGLDGKTDELRTGLVSAQKKIDSDNIYAASLAAEINKQVEQSAITLEGEIAEAKAHVAAADAQSQSTKAVFDRQQSMVNSSAASAEMLRPTQHKLDATRFDKDAEAAKLSQKVSELGAIKKGIFVGSQSSSLAALAQKRRDLTYDAQRLSIEAGQLASSLKTHQVLADAERRRFDSLTDATVRTVSSGVVLSLGVAQGRHVNPGDSIATLVDCNQSFAVGIFSYRQAQNLTVGTPVTISSSDPDVPKRGRVSEVLPKTSDKTDQLYAVPFPQTERREMYVLVSLDRPASDTTEGRFSDRKHVSACSVGQWVTITRENSWIPSASVAWRATASMLTGPTAQSALTATVETTKRAVDITSDAVMQLASSPPAKKTWSAISASTTEAFHQMSRGITSLANYVSPAPSAGATGSDKSREHRAEYLR